MNSEELTRKAEKKNRGTHCEKGRRITEENWARGFRNRVFATRNDERA